jgi:copper chaperone NosL
MIISDDRFAASVVTDTGEAFKFDDIGCLIQHEASQIRPRAAYWVCSFAGRDWLDARGATFVHSARVRSPMDHGFAALPTREAARELFQDASARTMRFTELPWRLGDQPSEPARDGSKPK